MACVAISVNLAHLGNLFFNTITMRVTAKKAETKGREVCHGEKAYVIGRKGFS
jgi:hypothetical protein